MTAISGSGLLFGWAKPTPVNPSNLRDRRNGEVLVAIAGPASNLVMAVVGGIVWRALRLMQVEPPPVLVNVLYIFVAVNIALAVFNMIPIPPLDGSALLFRLVSPATAWQLRPMLAQYGSLLLLVVIFGIVLTPLGTVVGRVIYDLTNVLLGN